MLLGTPSRQGDVISRGSVTRTPQGCLKGGMPPSPFATHVQGYNLSTGRLLEVCYVTGKFYPNGLCLSNVALPHVLHSVVMYFISVIQCNTY